MHARTLHPWNITAPEAVALQRKLAGQIIEGPSFLLSKARIIAGADVSSSRDSPLLTAGIVLWDRETNTVREAVTAEEPAAFPYVPGLLSFREIPVLLRAFEQLSLEPDVVLVDGHGRAHPRRVGIASHIGLLIDCPTIGVAKSRLTGTEGLLDAAAGSIAPLQDGSEEIGRLLRSKARSSPLYVSVGNGISLDSALEIVRACLRGYRLPEPTRLAHRHVNAARVRLGEARRHRMLH